MAQQTEKTLEIWTDGACKCNPGIGGWGAYMVWGAHTREMYGGSKLTTNNQMELTAVISALSALRRKCPIIIHTDSSYVKDGITKWIHGWKRNGWGDHATEDPATAGEPPTRSPSRMRSSGSSLTNLPRSSTSNGAG